MLKEHGGFWLVPAIKYDEIRWYIPIGRSNSLTLSG